MTTHPIRDGLNVLNHASSQADLFSNNGNYWIVACTENAFQENQEKV